MADGNYNTQFRKAFAAHQAAQEVEGLAPDSAEYFAYIDRMLGFSEDGNNGGGTRTRTATDVATSDAPLSSAAVTVEVDLSKTSVAPALPPTRTLPQRSGTSVGGKVRLTPGELEAARISNPDLWRKDQNAAIVEYAENKAELIAEGRISG
jgi:hypothetical protein